VAVCGVVPAVVVVEDRVEFGLDSAVAVDDDVLCWVAGGWLVVVCALV
jgi:hypothetical protein